MKIIRKEIVIDAPLAKVWEHITDPAKIADWLMPNDFEARVGRAFSLDCNMEGTISCVVQEVIPQRKLVYSFQPKDLQAPTIVTITLAAEKNQTRLTLVHSGWDALPPRDQAAADAFDEGWGSRLKILQEQLAQATST